VDAKAQVAEVTMFHLRQHLSKSNEVATLLLFLIEFQEMDFSIDGVTLKVSEIFMARAIFFSFHQIGKYT